MTKFSFSNMVDLGAVVTKVLSEQAAKSSTSMTQKDVKTVAPAVEKAVQKEVADKVDSVIENQTNQEPWYKSRVTRGAIATIIAAVGAVFYDWLADGQIESEVLTSAVTTIATAAYTIYGRWTSAGTPTI